MKITGEVQPQKDTPVVLTIHTTLEECKSMLDHINSNHWPLSDFKMGLTQVLQDTICIYESPREFKRD